MGNLMRRFVLATAVFGAILGTTGRAGADLVTNGGFEDPAIPAGTFSYLPSISGWTLASGPAIEIQNHVAGSPFQGNQFVELDSSANSSMYQDLATVAGQEYELSFAYSPRPGIAADSNGIEVSFGGAPVTSLALSGVGLSDTAWQVYTFDLTAISSETRLQFTATGISDTLGGYIDAVSVTAAPEPSTVALAVSAIPLALVVWIRRRRRAA